MSTFCADLNQNRDFKLFVTFTGKTGLEAHFPGPGATVAGQVILLFCKLMPFVQGVRAMKESNAADRSVQPDIARLHFRIIGAK
jgi:hypothetical protein